MSEPTGDMRILIEQVAKALVDDPAQVSVNPVEEGGETVKAGRRCLNSRLPRTTWAE